MVPDLNYIGLFPEAVDAGARPWRCPAFPGTRARSGIGLRPHPESNRIMDYVEAVAPLASSSFQRPLKRNFTQLTVDAAASFG